MLVDPSLSVDDVIIAARLYYAEPGNECGGALHVALDDGNVEDGSIDFCARVALKVEPVDDGRPLDLAGYLLCGLLRRLGRDDRARVSEAMYP